jgi:DNA repair protein RadA/Sms
MLGNEFVGSRVETFVERDIDDLIEYARSMRARVLVVDTILLMMTPTLRSKPGSPSQVRACTDRIIDFAKSTGTPTLLIGYTTKAGYLAGPKQLGHSVDSVFELERHPLAATLRVLRCSKNRYGSCREAVLELSTAGFFPHEGS